MGSGEEKKKIVQIEDLSVAFGSTEVVKHVNIEARKGEIVGIVGESGSGKSITSLTLMGLLSSQAKVTSGKITVDGEVLREAGKTFDEKLYRKFQGSRMSMVFQEPMTSLNPTKKAGPQVDEILKLHTTLEKTARYEKVLETFQAVGLKDARKVYESYPHQLSGGMRQRVMIAMAVILHPQLIIADEPTTALDVTIQTQIVELLKEINEKEQNAMLFITHDLNLARRICHRIVVMQNGVAVEQGMTEDIFERPKEAYTRNLIEAVPSRLKPRVSVKERVQAEQGNAAGTENILEVKDLSVYYEDRSGILFGKKEKQCAVSHANFTISEGESLGLVGESGCGKTSLSKAILGINRNFTGEVTCRVARPQMIFQDPYSSLNPSKTIGWLLMEPLCAAGCLDKKCAMTKADRKAAAYDMLSRVGMEEKYFNRLPSELSGGQRQRISIAQALITNPGFIIADEPVSALDVTIQAQIMELLQKMQEEMKLSYLFISHDINVVYHMCDRIMVMKDGKIIEIGETEEIFQHPKEAYTKSLLG